MLLEEAAVKFGFFADVVGAMAVAVVVELEAAAATKTDGVSPVATIGAYTPDATVMVTVLSAMLAVRRISQHRDE